MKYTIYKTTNLLNGMFYIGKHQTEDINDSYLGSGVYLQRAISKYGKENFKKEILYIFETEEEMNAKEREIVNETLLNDPLCYNLMLGGEGGSTWKGKHHTLESRQKMSKAVYEHLAKEPFEVRSLRQKEAWIRLRQNPEKLASINAKRSIGGKKHHKSHPMSLQTRQKISESMHLYQAKMGRKPVEVTKPFSIPHGNKPERFVTNGSVEYRVNADEVNWYLEHGYVFGRNPNNKKPIALSSEARDNSSGKGKLIVHDPTTKELKRIDPNQLQDYLDRGWIRGYRK